MKLQSEPKWIEQEKQTEHSTTKIKEEEKKKPAINIQPQDYEGKTPGLK